jgi:hypothetical protein
LTEERQDCALSQQPGEAAYRPGSSRPGSGEMMVAAGCILCIVAAAALPWARAHATWKSIFLGIDIELGRLTFKLTDNPWLAAALICVATLCLAGLFWRRHAAVIAITASLLLLGGSVVYIIFLIEDAYDFLGIYDKLLELARSLPVVGSLVESVIRENLSISALPHVGVFVFIASTLLILSGGLLIRRRCCVPV